jgi:hypothetical protein
MTRCQYIGRTPETTAAGRPLEAGDTFDADLAHHHDRWLIESGRAIEIQVDEPLTGKALDARCKELEIDTKGMTADQKREAVKAAENAGGDAA